MFTVLVMYLCLQGTAEDCSSQQVWVSGTWVGDTAMDDCQKERTSAYNELKTRPSVEIITFECAYDEST
jgi:hypothetical protein